LLPEWHHASGGATRAIARSARTAPHRRIGAFSLARTYARTHTHTHTPPPPPPLPRRGAHPPPRAPRARARGALEHDGEAPLSRTLMAASPSPGWRPRCPLPRFAASRHLTRPHPLSLSHSPPRFTGARGRAVEVGGVWGGPADARGRAEWCAQGCARGVARARAGRLRSHRIHQHDLPYCLARG
jgi:hypothetical protein